MLFFIILKWGGYVFIYISLYRCFKVEEGIIQSKVDKLVEISIVRESKSFWGISMVLVVKKDGECVYV